LLLRVEDEVGHDVWGEGRDVNMKGCGSLDLGWAMPQLRRQHRIVKAMLAAAAIVPLSSPMLFGGLNSSNSGLWATRQFLPGQARYGRWVTSSSISCPSARRCVVVGQYQLHTPAAPTEAFVWTESANGWSDPVPLPGLSSLAANGAMVQGLSCGGVGSCVVVGSYLDAHDRSHAFLSQEVAGRWRAMKDVVTPGDVLDAVDCPALEDCVVGGASRSGLPLVILERRGTWGPPQSLRTSPAGKPGAVETISCSAPGECAVGGYLGQEPFVDGLVSGAWGTAAALPGVASLNVGDGGMVSSVDCAAKGACAAAGWITDASRQTQAFVDLESSGTWATAELPPGMATLAKGGSELASVSCAAVGACAATGWYEREDGRYAVADAAIGGTWHTVTPMSGIAATTHELSSSTSVSCWAPGDCTAVGAWRDGSGLELPWAATQHNGSWQPSVTVGGYTPHASHELAYLVSVICSGAYTCNATGTNGLDSGTDRAFVISESPRQRRDALASRRSWILAIETN
jgi:hypothetical protein